MHVPALFGSSNRDDGYSRLLRGYGLALLLVTGLHAAAWWWTRRAPVLETPVVIPPMMDVELSAPVPAAQPAPVPSAAAPASPAKKIDRAPKPKPKPKPPPKPAETPKAEKQPRPVKSAEEPETAHPAPKAAPPPVDSGTSSTGTPGHSSAPASQTGGSSAGKAGGGDQKVTPAHDAGYLHNPKPRYPAIAIARNWEGLVRLRVYVLPNGSPGQVMLHQSSGHDVLDQAALEVVRRWQFVPAKRGEQAIASWVVVPLVFKLDSGRQ